ncbi:F-box/FBD/LRR-repeat protein At1g13570-like [Bidens hawaiensis]|uniref:F-box/FBD/LRR-repeat protein At1g13570-like n=1 Tax=Bidens hawaiensis TaxID=980011 RepID=UPI00404B3424
MKAKHSTKAQRLSKAKPLPVDIITTLPQTIIETILCLVPIKDAARTSILSREWRYKWTKIPKLVFSVPYGDQMTETHKLFCALHQIMLLRQDQIHEFTLTINVNGDYSKFGYPFYEVDQIMLQLSRNHNVKRLTLRFDEPWKSSSYKLPVSFFSLHHLTDLDLSWCDLDHQPTFNGFGSLTSLSLECVTISIKTLLHILSNSPSHKSFSLLMLAKNIIGPEKSTMIELFKCLPVIEHLAIRSDIIPWFGSDLVPMELPTSLIHLKSFCFEQMTFLDGYGLTFLAVLIKNSPNLEKIELKAFWLELLNELKINKLRNWEAELEFVKFILSRSPKLKKLSWLDALNDLSEDISGLKSSTPLPPPPPPPTNTAKVPIFVADDSPLKNKEVADTECLNMSPSFNVHLFSDQEGVSTFAYGPQTSPSPHEEDPTPHRPRWSLRQDSTFREVDVCF